MNAADFDTQFDRLTGHFHLPTDATRETVAQDWYEAIQGYDREIVEQSITTLIRSAQDRYWPPMGKLLELCRGKASSSVQSGKCATCHGSTWIDVAPFRSNGMIYEGAVIRCPDCRVPVPKYHAPSHRHGLTAVEYREWSQGTDNRDYMPEGCKAKPWAPGAREAFKAEMLKAFTRLKIKLFGEAA
jgi:hypothetical protein